MIIESTLTNGRTDELVVCEYVITINGVNYDLQNNPLLDKDESPACRVYADADEKLHIRLKVDIYHLFDFQNHNYELFFDKDLNSDLSLEELTAYVKHYNLTEAERVGNRKKIRAGYTDEEWNARLEKLGIAY